MAKKRLYILQNESLPPVFQFLLPVGLAQEFIVGFFQRMRFYTKSLAIIGVKEDEGNLCMVFNVSVQGIDLIEFSQWIELFCRDKGIGLTDLWNRLKLKK